MKEKIFSTFFLKILSAFLSFIIVILLSQVLGAEGRGEASIFLTTLSIVLILSEFVGGGSLIYLIPRSNIRSLLATSYIWALLVSFISYFLIIGFLLVKQEFVLHIVIIAFILSIGGANAKVLIARESIGKSNFVQFIQVLIIFLSLVACFYLLEWRTIKSYIISLYLSAFIVCFVSFFFIWKDLQGEKGNKLSFLFKESLLYGSKNQAAHITQMLSFRLSYYILERFCGLEMVGVYSNAVSIAESIWLISKSIALVQISRITNISNDRYNKMLTVVLARQTIIWTILLLIPLLCLPEMFYVFLFGPEFSELPEVILSLAPGVVFFAVFLIVAYYFSGTGRYGVNAIASSVGLVITLISGLAFIPLFEMTGAGITSSISYLVTMSIVLFLFFGKQGSYMKIIPGKRDFLFIWGEIKSRVRK